ncbi:MAG TPA: hypothetical protein VFG69_11085 [Nannocystaceae bacterium]|nr:hypothetical protein [Nannocystaceae bacterium]
MSWCYRAILVLALALVPGCDSWTRPSGSAGDEPVARPVVADAGLRFAWPLGASARVTEKILKKGKHSTTHYRLETLLRDHELLVYYRDYEFVEIEGYDLANPEVREAVRKVEAQVMGAMPPYRIGEDGRWLGVRDLDAVTASAEGVLPAADVATIRKALASPEGRARIDERMRDVWRAWSEAWIGLTLHSGERLETTTQLLGADREIAVPIVVEHLGSVGDSIHLELTSTLTGDDAIAAIGDMFEDVATMVAGDPVVLTPSDVAKALQKTKVERTCVLEAVVDPDTLLPSTASLRAKVTVGEGDALQERIEEHEWTFAWNTANMR